MEVLGGEVIADVVAVVAVVAGSDDVEVEGAVIGVVVAVGVVGAGVVGAGVVGAGVVGAGVVGAGVVGAGVVPGH